MILLLPGSNSCLFAIHEYVDSDLIFMHFYKTTVSFYQRLLFASDL